MTDIHKDLPTDFIREIINEDIEKSTYGGRVHTRFPPEPNGYLHIGHAKSICINFGIARDFAGLCNLRFDDTNPTKEEIEYVESIQEDVKWLGFDWEDRIYYASDYFEQLYEFAEKLIKKNKAYVDDLTPEQIKDFRGTLTKPGIESPFRNRTVAENLDLFRRMRAGEFSEGTRVLRAKIDMSSGNLNLRDPILYRILHQSHHRTGSQWCIYPMYDFAHGQCDSIEGITHSICTLEFQDHRPLYDWFLEELEIFHPKQIEFARLNLSYTVLSKRKLLRLVEEGYVSGWNDPRMPTISGIRRRGYSAEAVKEFCDRIGVAKNDSIVDIALLEYSVRQDLNKRAPRVMGILNPLKVVLINYPEGIVEEIEAINNPEDPSMGTRNVPFSRILFIDKDDFREVPPPKYYRLSVGKEVRLRYAYLIKCVDVIKDPDSGEILEIHCTYDPNTKGGDTPDGRKVKSTIQWVSSQHAISAELRLYDRLFNNPNPDDVEEGEDFISNLNPDSLTILEGCPIEPSLRTASPGEIFQFERVGYFCVDLGSKEGNLVFNRTVTLRDSWAKIEKALQDY